MYGAMVASVFRQLTIIMALAASVTGAPASAQQYYAETWYVECEPDTRTAAEVCFAQIWTEFRGFMLFLSAKDTDAESFVRTRMPKIEIRYAQMALLPAGTIVDLVCQGAECAADEETARTILDGLPDARELRFRFTVGTGQVAMVDMQSQSYRKAVSALAGM